MGGECPCRAMYSNTSELAFRSKDKRRALVACTVSFTWSCRNPGGGGACYIHVTGSYVLVSGSDRSWTQKKTFKAPNQLKLLLQILKRRTEGRNNLRSFHGEILSSVLVRPRFLQAKPTNSRSSLAWPRETTPGKGGWSLPQTSYARMKSS